MDIELSSDLLLTGDHVNLEPLKQSHCSDLNKAAADGELWGLACTRVPNEQEMLGYIDEALALKKEGWQFPFIVRRIADNKIVGCTRYYDIEQAHQNLAIGFTWYAQSAQRTAVNTETKLLLLTHAFDVMECISVAFHVDDTNHASQAAVTRLGAVHEGVLRNHKIMPDGRIRHTHCYSITNSEWPEVKQRLFSLSTGGLKD